MDRVEAPGGWRQRLAQVRDRGQTVGVVLTMGALHEGHLSLVQAARDAGANYVTMSIFVNPTQFNNPRDLSDYPRTLHRDLEMAKDAGVDLVFSPTAEAMRQLPATTHVLPPHAMAVRLEGEHRPGHFSGMATVVTKLLVLSGRCIAAFGKKDYQQLAIIRQLADDLWLDAQIIAAETVREPTGLACSSRNELLSSGARMRAAALYDGLRAARQAYAKGERSAEKLRTMAQSFVANVFEKVDYITVATQNGLQPIENDIGEPSVILAAAHLEGVRLIDNIELM